MIPPIVHQIWMQGSRAVPEKYSSARETWHAPHFALWTIKTWDEADLYGMARSTAWEDVIACSRSLIQRADIYRVMLLQRFGGVYVDMDMHALQSLNRLISDNSGDIQVGATSLGKYISLFRVNNAIIFSPAAHPLHERIREEMHRRLLLRSILDDFSSVYSIIRSTGPGVWSHFHKDLKVHDSELFFSLKKIKKHQGRLGVEDLAALKGSFTYHMQDSAWMTGWESSIVSIFVGNNWKISVPILILTTLLFLVVKIRSVWSLASK